MVVETPDRLKRRNNSPRTVNSSCRVSTAITFLITRGRFAMSLGTTLPSRYKEIRGVSIPVATTGYSSKL